MITSTVKIYAPKSKVWDVLTNPEHFRNWYFKIDDFQLQVGHEFSFYEAEDSKEYLHVCKIEKIEQEEKYVHSWAYPNQSKGNSLVSWKLEQEGNATVLTLDHEGVESFADGGDAFKPENFKMGWDGFMAIIKNYINGIIKLKFEIEINASKEKVWDVLWNSETYKQWTEVFHPGSQYKGDLKAGGRIHFVSSELDGMFSDVIFYTPNEFVLFQHLGDVKEGEEQPIDDEKNFWSGCFEQYSLKENNGRVILKVEVDVVPDYAEYFNEAFPKGLRKIKELSEKI